MHFNQGKVSGQEGEKLWNQISCRPRERWLDKASRTQDMLDE